jgi:hypothetical protein
MEVADVETAALDFGFLGIVSLRGDKHVDGKAITDVGAGEIRFEPCRTSNAALRIVNKTE